MPDEIKGLIDKIKKEGIDAANAEAEQIKQDAQKKAQGIIQKAKDEAAGIVKDAKEEATKTKESTRQELQQAARDVLIHLKKEIQDRLHALVSKDLRTALEADTLASILKDIIKDVLQKNSQEEKITVLLNQKDLDKLKKGFIAKLQDKLKKGIEFKASDDVDSGMAISFDEGKSYFDFTEKSLADYISVYLNEEIAALLEAEKK